MNISPIIVSLKLAAIATVILLIVGIPLARFFVFSKKRWKFLPEILTALPMVLPPTVLGFYILVALSPNSGPAKIIHELLGIHLLFNFQGIVLASVIFSLPHMLAPLKNGMSSIDVKLIETAHVLGKNKRTIFWKVIIPNMKGSILSGTFSAFAHTLGAFGAIIMIGGNIPGSTKVVSIAIYEKVEEADYMAANSYALILVVICTLLLFGIKMAEKTKGGRPHAKHIN